MRVVDSLLVSPGEERLHSSLRQSFAGLAEVDGEFAAQTTFSELLEASRAEVLQHAAGSLRDPYGWYLQTSVDLTFCVGASKTPLFSIEFDGMTNGFSRAGEFVKRGGASARAARTASDPYRAAKLSVKLRMAAAAGYPLVVLGWDEIQPVATNEALTIADGVAAELLAPGLIEQKMISLAAEQGTDLSALPAEDADWIAWRAEQLVRDAVDPFRRASQTMLADLGAAPAESLTMRFGPGPVSESQSIRATRRAQQDAAYVESTARLRHGGVDGTGTARSRNLWLPLDERELSGIPRWIRDSPNVAITGEPIAENLTRNVARYLALLDLWEHATASE